MERVFAEIGGPLYGAAMRQSEPIAIRPYAEGDAPAMARLYFESARTLGPRRYAAAQVAAWAPAPADPARFHARATDGRLTLVAVDPAGALLAYGDLEADGHIDHLYCHPDAAGTGLAARLLDALLAHAAAEAMPRLHVEASELARSLFARKGFRVVRRRDFEIAGVAIHNYAMECDLP
ncbi:GNAT family N-acetyltransferase [Flavisphingomonas formosensis]|uniref:GNAT family N-acetyltransferase n=1 Tax=Flavisphingomonas formosensis TaxID=861534 RepID=UPI001E33A85B|nr:GNAT family N-acetyltransferase [Sphingomonas formosensis]